MSEGCQMSVVKCIFMSSLNGYACKTLLCIQPSQNLKTYFTYSIFYFSKDKSKGPTKISICESFQFTGPLLSIYYCTYFTVLKKQY